MNIGIFGLTGDPCTCAHYEIVRKILRDKIVDRVVVIPTIVDYYRLDKQRMFTNEQRLEIINKWFNEIENVIIDDFEYNLIRKSPGSCADRRYWHTLQDAMIRYGKDNEYCTIVGCDSWNNLESWFNFKELGKMTKFIVITRDKSNLENLSAKYKEYEMQPYKVVEMDEIFKSVSATEVRKHLEKVCTGMSTGPGCSALSVYLEEIEDYKETGKIYIDRAKEYDTAMNAVDEKLNMFDGEELLAHTQIFDLIKSPEVEAGFRPVKIKSPDWVSIIVEKDSKFMITKQFRHGLGKEFEEFPCGMIESGEGIVEAGTRELEEETGIRVKDKRSVHYLGKFAANPAFMSNYMHYLHVNLNYALYDEVKTKFDEHEHLTSYWVEKKEAFERFVKSEGSAIMGCAMMLLMKNLIIKEWNI